MDLQSYQVTVQHHQVPISLDISKISQVHQELSNSNSDKIARQNLENLRSKNFIKINFQNLPHLENKYLEFTKSLLELINNSLKKVIKSAIPPKKESQAELTEKKVTFASSTKEESQAEQTDKLDTINNSLISEDDNNQDQDIFNTAIGEGIQQYLDSDSDIQIIEMPDGNEANAEAAKLAKIERYLKSMPSYKKDEDGTNFEDYCNELESYFNLVGEKDDDTMINLVKHKVSKFKNLKMTFEEGHKEHKTFKKLIEYAIGIVDAKNKQTDAQIYLQATKIKLASYNDARKYFQAFVNLKAEASNKVDEKVLVEAFIDNIGIQHLKSQLKMAKKTDSLFENFKILELAYEPKETFNANNANFNRNRGYGGSSNDKNWRNKQPWGRGSSGGTGGGGRGGGGSRGRAPLGKGRGGNSQGYDTNKDSNVRCHLCRRTGHKAAGCPRAERFRKFDANLAEYDDGYDYDNRRDYERGDDDKENQGQGGSGSSENNINYSIGFLKVDSMKNKNVTRKHILQNSGTSSINQNSIDLNFPTGSPPANLKVAQLDVSTHADSSNSKYKNAIHPRTATHEIYRVSYSSLVKKEVEISCINNKNIHKWTPKVDSGASRSIISAQNVHKFGAKICTEFNFSVTGFDGETSGRILGYVPELTVKIKGHRKISFSPIVVDNIKSDLLGIDIIRTVGGGDFSLDKNGDLQWTFHCEKEQDSMPDSFKIRAAETIEIKPGHMQSVKIKNLNFKNDFMVESRNKKNLALVTLDGIITDKTETICICNLNKENKILIQDGQHISNAYPLDTVSQQEILSKIGEIADSSSKLSEKEISDEIEKKTSHIKNLKIREKLKEILYKNITAFDIGSSTVGQYKPSTVSINPNNLNLDIKSEKRRSHNPNVWDKMSQKLKELEDLDLIEPCPFPLVAPANLVPAKRKGSDQIRLCVDYKRLNEVISHNFFPLPTHDELLGSFANGTSESIFCKFDISACFHNFVLELADRALTAFYTQRGVYQWKVLPFGIKSAPGIVQQAMTNMLWSKDLKLNPSTVRDVFIDDILSMFENMETALPDIDALLKHFHKTGLKLKWKKCEFLKKKVEYMGSHLDNTTDQGILIKADPENIECLKKLDTPKDTKSLKSFLGMVGWIAKFVRDIHLELGPLHNIISKMNDKARDPKLKFDHFWTKNIDNLYKSIIEKISAPENLSVPDFSLPFEIEADASSFGFGGVCTQTGPDGKKRIIQLASKALTKEAVNYENIHRETACTVWAVDKFYKFFCCSPHATNVYTDNRVTSFIRSATSSKLKRWRSILDSYNINLMYRPGKEQVVSDALSRLTRNPKTGHYETDLSDEILEEVVIAAAVDSDDKDVIGLYQLHLKHGHCSADRLSKISDAPRSKCDELIKLCFDCASRSKVRENRQILGTITDQKEKNHTWMCDFVFFEDSDKKFISILDRSTRFFTAVPVPNRGHHNIIKALTNFFRTMGKPKRLVADREYVSGKVVEFLDQKGIKFCPVTRESPWLNCVERYHQEVKKIANRSNINLIDAVDILNDLPFSSAPSGIKFKKISPSTLFFENDKEILLDICNFLEEESKKRSTRSEKLRGKNISRFERKFEIGDLVRFNLGNNIGFGKITAKTGSKMYDISRIDNNRKHSIHSQQLEKVIIPERLLLKLLE